MMNLDYATYFFAFPLNNHFSNYLVIYLKAPWGQRIEIRIQEVSALRERPGFLGRKGLDIPSCKHCETWIRTFFTKKVELPISRQVKIKSATLRSGKTVWFSAKLALDTPILVVTHKKSVQEPLAWRLTKPLMAENVPHYSLKIAVKPYPSSNSKQQFSTSYTCKLKIVMEGQKIC